MAKKTTSLKDLQLDPMNANRHSKLGTGLLENSMRENGLGRSIVISNDNVVIAGNGSIEAAAVVGVHKMRVIETTGDEIIAVKRTDIKSGTEEFYRLALADNVVAQKNIVMDADIVEAIVVEHPATKVWGEFIINPPGMKETADSDKAEVTMTFKLSGAQGAKVKQAIKIAKELNKVKMDGQGNDNQQGNALFFICQEYLKAHK